MAEITAAVERLTNLAEGRSHPTDVPALRQDIRTVLSALPMAHHSADRLPDVLDGHWTSSEGRQMAERYASKERGDLMMGERPDLGLANAIFLVGRDDLRLIEFQQAAKERIRWLSVQLAIAQAAATPRQQP